MFEFPRFESKVFDIAFGSINRDNDYEYVPNAKRYHRNYRGHIQRQYCFRKAGERFGTTQA